MWGDGSWGLRGGGFFRGERRDVTRRFLWLWGRQLGTGVGGAGGRV